MPRNGSGVYSPTAGIPVVSGTTISSTAINNVLDDLGDEITASLPVSGVAPMTGALRVTLGSVSAPGLAFSGDTDTGIYSTGANTLSIGTAATNAVTFSATQTTTWTGKAVGKAFDVDAITDVASASTCDIGAAATSEVRITGTTTITSFGTSNAGIRRKGRFAAALTLTHNATSLILPGGANITTAANDTFEALSLGSGNWIVTSYQAATGRSVVGGGLTVISSGTASGASTIDITLPTGYRSYRLVFGPVGYPSTDGSVLGMRFSYDGGSTFAATNYSWGAVYTSTQAAATTGGFSSNDAGAWGALAFCLSAFAQDNSASATGTFEVEIFQGDGSRNPAIFYRAHHLHSSGAYNGVTSGSGNHTTLDTIDAIRLLYSAGNINGPWVLYGIV